MHAERFTTQEENQHFARSKQIKKEKKEKKLNHFT